MGFSLKHYVLADDFLKEVRAANAAKLSERQAEIERRFPEYAGLRRELARTGAKIAEAIIAGGDVKGKIQTLRKENEAVKEKIAGILKSGKYPADYLDGIVACGKCGDSGVAGVKRCDCFMDAVKRFAAEEINSRSSVKLTAFGSFDLSLYPEEIEKESGTSIRKLMKGVYHYCVDYTDNFHLPCSGIVMSGKTGLGKTHLSLAIANGVLQNGYNAVYGSAPDLFRKIEREHFGNESKNQNTLETLQEADLLILDDIGAEFESPFYASAFYNLLNSRMNAGLPVIVSTNYNVDEIGNRYHERITSRLFSMKILEFYGNDIRFLKRTV